jgi:glycoside hydrolase-like protein
VKRRNVALLSSAAALAVLGAPWVVKSPVAAATEQLASVTARIADIPAKLASAITGRHLGFDTSEYPGDDAMRTWKASAPYEWVGYYLPAPCHKDDSWSGKRQTLASMGWGLAVVYVGQQSWGKDPAQPVRTTVRQKVRDHRGRVRTVRKVVSRPLTAAAGTDCSAAFLTTARGRRDADDAILRTVGEGFPSGTVVFLDIERMERVPQAMRDYYLGWTRRVLEDGRFVPGYYVHTHNAQSVYADVSGLFQSLHVAAEPRFWVAGNGETTFSPHREPTDVGHEFASMWQGILDRFETRSGVRLPIDVSVASVQSPSGVATD